MYVRLDAIQSQTEEWIQRSWKAGHWSPNAVINSDGVLVDARLKAGLRPSPVTRDLTWGVPVPDIEGKDNQEMLGKVLCEYTFCGSSLRALKFLNHHMADVWVWRNYIISTINGSLFRYFSLMLQLGTRASPQTIQTSGRNGGSILTMSNCTNSWGRITYTSIRSSFRLFN